MSMLQESQILADAINDAFVSSDLFNTSGHPANVTDAIQSLAGKVSRVSDAITPPSAGHDAFGNRVECLTESVMGVTTGLEAIASAINNLADAVRES